MDTKTFQTTYYAGRLLYPKVRVTARIPMAIARQETQLGTTGVGVSCNNLFGMNKPKARKTTATGATAKGIAIFDTKESSIRDFLLFLDQMGLYTDELLWKFIADLRYNENPAYPPAIDKIVGLQAPQVIPFSQFVMVGTAGAIGLACAIKVASVVIKKL